MHKSVNPSAKGSWQALDGLKTTSSYVPGKQLFATNDPPNGIYLLEEGTVSLLWSSETRAGRLFESVGPGAALGLAECLTGDPYRFSAQATELSRVSFIERPAFLAFMREYPEFCMQVVRLLSENLHTLYYHFHWTPAAGGRKRLAH